jgi:hypothetical protein
MPRPSAHRWHSQEKGDLITSQPSRFQYDMYMWIPRYRPYGHHAKALALNYSLEAQNQKIKINKAKNRGNKWA